MRLSPRVRRVLSRVFLIGAAAQLFAAAWLVGRLSFETLDRRKAAPAATALSRKSADCRSCHEQEYAAWAGSHHAHAHRPVDAVADAAAFQSPRPFVVGDVEYRVGWERGNPRFEEHRPGVPAEHFAPEFVLGHTPLRQLVIPLGNGRYQMSELAFDPAKREWFDVFGAENRQPGEWGHWRGRGMNWNSMCAHCHLTEFSKNYDPKSDGYRSTWLEHGVGCVQCHDALTPDHTRPGYVTPPSRKAQTRDAARNQETCAPCHARNELLVGEPRPGLGYFDHFRVALPVDPAVFYPDGQVRDEDFNWSSLLTSRMGGKAGVTCLDCHEPHSGRTKLPAANNVLCLRCHGGPNAMKAPIIEPTAHSHHQATGAGNQCIACHMPTTTYMQRDPRHDHGFLKPDPLLTKELGIPNACNRCHADRGLEWQIEANERWYGPKLDSRQRQRARAVAGAQAFDPTSPERLLAVLAGEDVPAWRATLLLLLVAWPQHSGVVAAAQSALRDPAPLVRSAAVQVVAANGQHRAELRDILRDPSRLVRVEAEWALADELAPGSPEENELVAYLNMEADQPVGQMRIGQRLAMKGQFQAAQQALHQASAWDPKSPVFPQALAAVLNAAGDDAAAADALWRAAQLEVRNGDMAFEAALGFAAAGRMTEAETALREAVRREPGLHRAWYNLGLLLARTGRPSEAIGAFDKAESLAPNVADYPYAAATVHWGLGHREAAKAAARRAVAVDPTHAGAQELLTSP